MTCRNFLLQKENDCKVQLCFTKCCTHVVTERYHITFSAEQISHMRFCYVEDVYHKNELSTIGRKGSVASVKGAGGSEPLIRGFRGWSP